jgi:hypothetical protein
VHDFSEIDGAGREPAFHHAAFACFCPTVDEVGNQGGRRAFFWPLRLVDLDPSIHSDVFEF